MVKITDGRMTIEVTTGAFNAIYSKQGFRRVNEPAVAQVENDPPELTDDEKFLADIAEKPLSQWSKEEVRHFAELKGIGLEGVKNTTEAKDRLKPVLGLE